MQYSKSNETNKILAQVNTKDSGILLLTNGIMPKVGIKLL